MDTIPKINLLNYLDRLKSNQEFLKITMVRAGYALPNPREKSAAESMYFTLIDTIKKAIEEAHE